MNNRLKFRVWDGDNKAFAYFDTMTFRRGNTSRILDGIPRISGQLFAETQQYYKIGKDAISTRSEEKNCTVQQCTGMTDVFGQSIYDGDLIKGDKCGPYRVFWENGSWCSCCYSDCDPISRYKRIEVVGNIFENSPYEGQQ